MSAGGDTRPGGDDTGTGVDATGCIPDKRTEAARMSSGVREKTRVSLALSPASLRAGV